MGAARPTKVFGVGLHKTGTSTLGECLRVLGYDVCPEEAAYATLDDVAARDYGACLEVAQNYDGFQDSPWNCTDAYKVLDAAFPQAQFILTRREENRWFGSFLRWARQYNSGEAPAVLCTLGGPLTAGRREASIRAYRRHNAGVIDYFSATERKLLVVDWEAGDGWRRLCDFLDQPVPDVSFPHVLRSQ